MAQFLEESVMDPGERMRALNKKAEVVLDTQIPARRYYRQGNEMMRMANIYEEEGCLEDAYVLFLKYSILFLDKIREHPEFCEVPAYVKSESNKHLKIAVEKAEKLEQKVIAAQKRRHKEWQELERQKAVHVVKREKAEENRRTKEKDAQVLKLTTLAADREANFEMKNGMGDNTRKDVLLIQAGNALQTSSACDSIKTSSGEAIVQLENVKALVGKTDASVDQLKKQVEALENSATTTTKLEERCKEIEKTLKRLELMEGRFKLLEEENENLKADNKFLAVKVQSMEEKQIRTETELQSKLKDKVEEFKKLFEDVGESFTVVEENTTEEFGRIEARLEEAREKVEEVREKLEEVSAGIVESRSQQRKELRSAVRELEVDMEELTEKLDGFKSKTKKKIRGLGKKLDKLKKDREEESSSGGDER